MDFSFAEHDNDNLINQLDSDMRYDDDEDTRLYDEQQGLGFQEMPYWTQGGAY